MIELDPREHVAPMKCSECGHEYKTKPAAATQDESGVHLWFGSDFSFCPECDGPPQRQEA